MARNEVGLNIIDGRLNGMIPGGENLVIPAGDDKMIFATPTKWFNNLNKLAKPLASKSGWTIISGDGFPGDDQISNNSSGFNMLPVGYYTSLDGEWGFEGLGLRANLWTLTENDNSSAYNTRVYFNRDDFSRWAGSKNDGFSVRFLRK